MKVGSKVELKQTLTLMPVDASTPRSAFLTEFAKGTQFTLTAINGEHATVRDSDGNFWSVLLGLLGLVQEAASFDGETTVNEGVTWLGKVANWFKSLGGIKIKNPFKKKK